MGQARRFRQQCSSVRTPWSQRIGSRHTRRIQLAIRFLGVRSRRRYQPHRRRTSSTLQPGPQQRRRSNQHRLACFDSWTARNRFRPCAHLRDWRCCLAARKRHLHFERRRENSCTSPVYLGRRRRRGRRGVEIHPELEREVGRAPLHIQPSRTIRAHLLQRFCLGLSIHGHTPQRNRGTRRLNLVFRRPRILGERKSTHRCEILRQGLIAPGYLQGCTKRSPRARRERAPAGLFLRGSAAQLRCQSQTHGMSGCGRYCCKSRRGAAWAQQSNHSEPILESTLRIGT
jgi:hypothetical protein